MHSKLSVAPMMDWTDRHCRYFHRVLAPDARLYTEMVTADAVIHGDREHLIGFHQAEHPVALQLGGNDPRKLAEAARIGADFGYDEINLNVGCPSDRVQSGRFGACLMAEPETVARCVSAMAGIVGVPVTVKSRIGIDDVDDYAYLRDFVQTVAAGGCRHFYVHARNAWLSGLSPKENREIPPLRHERVYRLKEDFPEFIVVINGGIDDVPAMRNHLERGVDGVMIGRAAYRSPWLLAEASSDLGLRPGPATPREAVIAMFDYVENHLQRGGRLASIARHMLGLFQACPGARRWRRFLSEQAHRPEADAHTLRRALSLVGEPRVLPGSTRRTAP